MFVNNCFQWVFIGIAFVLSIVAIIQINQESFSVQDGYYQTFNTQCRPNKKKCVVKNNSGSYHYYCSDKCTLGEEVKEPMDWAVRFA